MAKDSRILTRLAVRMVLAVIVAWGAATVFTNRLEDSYRARLLLNLAPIPFRQDNEVPMNLANLGDPTAHVSYLKVQMLEALAMPDYNLILTSEEVATKVRDKMKELYREKGIEPGNLTVERVRRSMEVRTKVLIQTLKDVEYQQMIELLVTAKDPEVAAQAANYWAEIGIEKTTQMRIAAREGGVELISSQLEVAWERYEDMAAKVEALDREMPAGPSVQRLASLEESVTQGRLQQSSLAGGVARIEAEIAQIEAELAKPQTEGRSDRIRVELTERLLLSKTELAGTKAEREALAGELTELEPQAAELRGELARVNHERTRYTIEADAQTRRIEELNLGLHAMELAAADTVPEFKMASRAVTPEERTGPHRKLIVLVAVFLAAVAVPVHLFGMVALRRYAHLIESEAFRAGGN